MGRLAAVSVDLDTLPHYLRIQGLDEKLIDDRARALVSKVAIDRYLELFDGRPATFFAIGEDLADPDMARALKAAHGASDQRPIVRRVATRMHNKLLWAALGFKGTDTHGLKAFRRQSLLATIQRCVVDMDVFASEFVVRAWRDGLNVLEIPIQLHEKRQPSIHLFRRVPNVLRNVAKLVYVIRVRGQ